MSAAKWYRRAAIGCALMSIVCAFAAHDAWNVTAALTFTFYFYTEAAIALFIAAVVFLWRWRRNVRWLRRHSTVLGMNQARR